MVERGELSKSNKYGYIDKLKGIYSFLWKGFGVRWGYSYSNYSVQLSKKYWQESNMIIASLRENFHCYHKYS